MSDPVSGFMTAWSQWLDRLAVALSGICLLHCLLLVVFLTVFPALTLGLGGNQHFHELMLWLVVPVSVVGLYLGYRRHRRGRVPILGLVAMAVLMFASTWGHDHLSNVNEVLLMVTASVALAAAHVLNFQAVRDCKHSHAREVG